MKTIIYVDGFNLYYGALKGTPYKWLDLLKLSHFLLPKNEIVGVKYFTARISVRPGDPQQPGRQQTYLRALKTLPHLSIIYGHFLSHTVLMPLANLTGKQKYVSVIKTEEKGSDVNLASHLINDGYQGRYGLAVLVTNDSDLLEPIKIVRKVLNLPVGLLNPHKKPSRVLMNHASFIKPIRKGVLAASQLPDVMHDKHGFFHKPASW